MVSLESSLTATYGLDGLDAEGSGDEDNWLNDLHDLRSSLKPLMLQPVGTGAANVPKLKAAPAPKPPRKGDAFAIPGFGFSTGGALGDGRCGVANGSGDMGQGMNMDKRRCRQLHKASFVAGIAAYHREESSVRPAELRDCARAVLAWVRKRPLLTHELSNGEYDAVSTAAAGGRITTHACLMKPDLRRMFLRHATFAPSGGVFDESATSDDVYVAAGKPLVDAALAGGRGTMILYGQTGSGKTMTMAHVQQRVAAQLFMDGALAVEVRAVEVMGKKARDLSSGSECIVQQTAHGGAELRGATPHFFGDAPALGEHLKRVLRSRRTHATGANATSSRSHALITLTVGSQTVDEGVLTLLDCAGSEWAADSDAHDAQRRREGSEINASLHALKNCVRAHAERHRRAASGRAGATSSRVPYRDALLTRLLRDAFEGPDTGGGPSACVLAVVGCVSPGAADTEHSTSTLRTVMELAATTGDECTIATQDVPRVKPQAVAEAVAIS